MALHDDMLALARRLVPPSGGASPSLSPPDVDLRCGVSNAYYALFHLIISEATAYVVAVPALRARASRTIQHKTLKDVCGRYAPRRPGAPAPVAPSGLPVPASLRAVGEALAWLQEARHEADYDTSLALSHADADGFVGNAEAAFLHWAAAKADPTAAEFLADIFFKGLGK